MEIELVHGDLLNQPVEVIVNAWNRNRVPWWLLRPHGVSGAIKRRAGLAPFRELARYGPLALGEAVWTGAGRLPYLGIIHVAAISLWGRSTEQGVRESVRNALLLAEHHDVGSIAFPVLGSGSGRLSVDQMLPLMHGAILESAFPGHVLLVKYAAERPEGGRPTG